MKAFAFPVRLFALLLTAQVAAAAGGVPTISHERLTSVPANGNARIEASVASASTIVSVRITFHASGVPGDYFLEMRRGDEGRYWAVLPAIAPETKSVEYRIVAREVDGLEGMTPVVEVPVRPVPVSLSVEDRKYAANLVLGLTLPAQSNVPRGFLCEGVVSVITVAGDLKPNDECRKSLAAAAAAASRGVPIEAIVGGAAAAVAGGVIIANTRGGGSAPPVSSSRPATTAPVSPPPAPK